MRIQNIRNTTEWFEVLQTTDKSQTAMMRLSPGQKSGEEKAAHKNSDQVLLLLEGELEAEIGRKHDQLHPGDVCLIPAGTPHRFRNIGHCPAVTFNVYSPPEYPADEKG